MTCKGCKFWERRPVVATVRRTRRLIGGGLGTFVDVLYMDQIDKLHVGKVLCIVSEKRCHYGKCSNPKFVYTQTWEVRGDVEKTPGDGLSYNDDEGQGAYFHTGQDFGCIHFEEKAQ